MILISGLPSPSHKVVSCFSLAISSRLYVGFAVLSLLVEINTVFLHIRQLMLLSGWRNRPAGGSAPTTDPPRPTPAFRLTSLLNLATWVAPPLTSASRYFKTQTPDPFSLDGNFSSKTWRRDKQESLCSEGWASYRQIDGTAQCTGFTGLCYFLIVDKREAPNPFRCPSDLCLSLPWKVLGVPVVYTGLDDSVAGRTSGANSSVRPHAGNGGLGRHHCHERGSSLSVAPRGSADRHTNLRKGPLEGAAHVTEPPAYFHSDDPPNEMLIGHVPPAFTIDS